MSKYMRLRGKRNHFVGGEAEERRTKAAMSGCQGKRGGKINDKWQWKSELPHSWQVPTARHDHGDFTTMPHANYQMMVIIINITASGGQDEGYAAAHKLKSATRAPEIDANKSAKSVMSRCGAYYVVIKTERKRTSDSSISKCVRFVWQAN